MTRSTEKKWIRSQSSRMHVASTMPSRSRPSGLLSNQQKGKSFDTYHAHIAKSLELWCRSHHINRDKSIFLEAKFFKDLVALRFNPGGPVAQFHLVAQGMLMLACHSLTAMAAEFCRESEEAAESTKH